MTTHSSQKPVALITGASAGIGEAIARRFAKAGWRIVAVARRPEKLAALARELAEITEVRTLATDVSAADAPKQAVALAMNEFGRLDCLINNAFAIPPMEPLTTLDEGALRTSNETNVLAPLRLTRLLADALAESQGSVVFVNSAVVHHSRVEFGGYKLAKGALLHMASSLATELGLEVEEGVGRTGVTRAGPATLPPAGDREVSGVRRPGDGARRAGLADSGP